MGDIQFKPNAARRRANSIVQRNCCCFSSERFKDFWKYNQRGQSALKTMLALQFVLYLASVIIIFFDFFSDDVDTYFAFGSKLDFFYMTVSFWLFCASSYFQWHSMNRSIVVDLIAYGVLSTTLNLFLFYRSIDMLFISQSIKDPKSIEDQQLRIFDYVYMYITYAQLAFSILFTVFVLLILPAVYEDIKDNIFLALGGNTSLWQNFYNLTLSKSIIKLDLIFNCQFWTAFFFVVYDFQEDTLILKIIFWVANGFAFLLSIFSDYLGYWAVKRLKASRFTLFFIFRTLSELIKLFIVVQFWRKQTILFQPLVSVDDEFYKTEEGQRLRYYVTGNCAITFIMFLICIRRIYTQFNKKVISNPNEFKNTYEQDTYFTQPEPSVDQETVSDLPKNPLQTRILKILEV